MNINDKLYGFRVTRITEVKEIKAQSIEMEHEQTGLKLLWLNRKEENKTFGIAFTTLPYDDTGVFHILEHTVLGGSEKYPLREPFLELLKNSMNTFLNALTFPDKTMYPVSSRNHTDFMNLVKVYLDAVFNPLILKNPSIFRQEGWHYETDEEGNFLINGVVYNEMKGALASSDEIMETAMLKGLFPDSPYGYNYGGDPKSIPDLTYEDYIAAYHKFYSPSNAYVVLDGDLHLDEVLKYMDEEYLCKQGRTERIYPQPLQKPVKSSQEAYYEITPSEEAEGKTRLGKGYVIGGALDRKRIVGMNVVSEVLCGNNQAPLTRALLEKGLAEDVFLRVNDSILQPYATLEVRNFKDEDLEQIETLVQQTLEKIAEEGLPASLCEAIKANMEFRMRERDYDAMPQGLLLGFQVLESWVYGGEPEANLEVGTLFEELDAGYLTSLMKEVLLDNNHVCKIVLKPSRTIGEETKRAEQERVKAAVTSWSQEEKEDVLKKLADLRLWQETPDSQEALDSVPKLSLSDVGEPEDYPYSAKKIEGIKVLDHAIANNGIDYVTLYFDAEDLNEEELGLLSILNSLLGSLSTETYSASEIAQKVRNAFGRLSFSTNVYSKRKGNATARKWNVSFALLDNKKEEALALIKEVLLSTKFEEYDLIGQIIKQGVTGMAQMMVSSGQAAAASRTAARYTQEAAAREYSGGYEYYRMLKGMKDIPACAKKMEALLKKLAVLSRLTLSVAAEDMESFVHHIKDALPIGEAAGETKELALLKKENEGIIIGADVGFAVAGGPLQNKEDADNGIMNLIRRIAGFEYLWAEIRVKGGAYGAGCTVRNDGLVLCNSYRDPNCPASLQAFKGLPDYLVSFSKEDRDLTGNIIGAVSDSSPLCTARLQVVLADQMYWTDNSYELRCQKQEQLLGTTKEELAALAGKLRKALEQGSFCVVGSKEQVEACGCDVIREL